MLLTYHIQNLIRVEYACWVLESAAFAKSFSKLKFTQTWIYKLYCKHIKLSIKWSFESSLSLVQLQNLVGEKFHSMDKDLIRTNIHTIVLSKHACIDDIHKCSLQNKNFSYFCMFEELLSLFQILKDTKKFFSYV